MKAKEKPFFEKVVDCARADEEKEYQNNPVSNEFLEIGNATEGIGRKYPQTDIIDLVIAHSLRSYEAPRAPLDFGDIKIYDSARRTDCISTGAISAHGFLLSKKALEVFARFDMGRHVIHPARLVHKGESFEYAYLQNLNDMMSLIDYDQSSFYVAKLGGVWYADITIRDEEDFLSKWTLARLGQLEDYGNYKTVRAKKVVLKAGTRVPDYFHFRGTGIKNFISRNLAEGINEAKLSRFNIRTTRVIIDPGFAG